MSFFRQAGIGAVMALAIVATGTAWSQARAGETASQDKPVKITGTAAYRERIAVSSDAELVVELRESPSLGDDPDAGRLVASRSRRLEGRQVPAPFFLKIDSALLVPGTPYALRVALSDRGQPGWLSEPVSIMPRSGAEHDAGAITLTRVESLPLAFTSTLMCGDTIARFGMRDERPVLQVGDEEFALREVKSASGAKYEAEGDPDTSFWSKGETALVTLHGTQLPECRLTATRTQAPAGLDLLPGSDWVVEDIDRRGIIDNSRVTLAFTREGTLGGRATCNSYSTRFATNGGRISVDRRTVATMMACAPALMNQEAKFLSLLPTVTDWRIDETGALLLSAGEKLIVKAHRDG
ncbi:META domain-containing protein [Stappia sp.]|uniref:META domain-containing protein n=1 Tax=Stappia sp. TaxID=1870903 RepID=UPI003A9A0D58